jgi:hypothetical protein
MSKVLIENLNIEIPTEYEVGDSLELKDQNTMNYIKKFKKQYNIKLIYTMNDLKTIYIPEFKSTMQTVYDLIYKTKQIKLNLTFNLAADKRKLNLISEIFVNLSVLTEYPQVIYLLKQKFGIPAGFLDDLVEIAKNTKDVLDAYFNLLKTNDSEEIKYLQGVVIQILQNFEQKKIQNLKTIEKIQNKVGDSIE